MAEARSPSPSCGGVRGWPGNVASLMWSCWSLDDLDDLDVEGGGHDSSGGGDGGGSGNIVTLVYHNYHHYHHHRNRHRDTAHIKYSLRPPCCDFKASAMGWRVLLNIARSFLSKQIKKTYQIP
ncbi:hypothetical protein E2C01_083298 [Portunus trituberculatus]|uniref:Uncharacterized protein n=1 Tax=Portunus trituberculatus TaxID=210409 RepID=A0A5B7J495_PORTR|nr:hypothetical protein [Portunus trituberculatus]